MDSTTDSGALLSRQSGNERVAQTVKANLDHGAFAILSPRTSLVQLDSARLKMLLHHVRYHVGAVDYKREPPFPAKQIHGVDLLRRCREHVAQNRMNRHDDGLGVAAGGFVGDSANFIKRGKSTLAPTAAWRNRPDADQNRFRAPARSAIRPWRSGKFFAAHQSSVHGGCFVTSRLR